MDQAIKRHKYPGEPAPAGLEQEGSTSRDGIYITVYDNHGFETWDKIAQSFAIDPRYDGRAFDESIAQVVDRILDKSFNVFRINGPTISEEREYYPYGQVTPMRRQSAEVLVRRRWAADYAILIKTCGVLQTRSTVTQRFISEQPRFSLLQYVDESEQLEVVLQTRTGGVFINAALELHFPFLRELEPRRSFGSLLAIGGRRPQPPRFTKRDAPQS